MKKILKFIMILSFISALFAGCNLDRPIFDGKENDKPWTMDDATSQWRGLYATFRACFYGTIANATDIMSDQFNASAAFGNRGGILHQLSRNMLSDPDHVGAIWSGCYARINILNNFLLRIKDVPVTSDNKTTIERYISEAKFMRAYIYYLLVKHYAPDYEPATAKADLGVTITTAVNDISLKHARVSVDSVYNYILNELEGVVEIITNADPKFITKDAVLAFKGKIYLCMHRYAECVTTLGGITKLSSLTKTAEDLKRYWVEDATTEDLFAPNVSAIESAPTNSIYTGFNGTRFVPDFWPTAYVTDSLFGGVKDTTVRDFRKGVYFSDYSAATYTPQSGVYYLVKFPKHDMYGLNMVLHRPKAIRLGEVYLMLAEAAGHQDNPSRSEANALNWLNTLRTARGMTALPAWDEQAMKDEWAREMIGEGVRIECLKRWHEGYNGRPAQKNGAAVMEQGGENFTERVCEPDYYRFILPIPLTEMQTNSNMKQTPGWAN